MPKVPPTQFEILHEAQILVCQAMHVHLHECKKGIQSVIMLLSYP